MSTYIRRYDIKATSQKDVLQLHHLELHQTHGEKTRWRALERCFQLCIFTPQVTAFITKKENPTNGYKTSWGTNNIYKLYYRLTRNFDNLLFTRLDFRWKVRNLTNINKKYQKNVNIKYCHMSNFAAYFAARPVTNFAKQTNKLVAINEYPVHVYCQHTYSGCFVFFLFYAYYHLV